jgi:hypothetical protein
MTRNKTRTHELIESLGGAQTAVVVTVPIQLGTRNQERGLSRWASTDNQDVDFQLLGISGSHLAWLLCLLGARCRTRGRLGDRKVIKVCSGRVEHDRAERVMEIAQTRESVVKHDPEIWVRWLNDDRAMLHILPC